jgi:hypothetical protein
MKQIKFSFAEATPLLYKLNTETGYYILASAPIGFTALPNELKMERTQDKKIRSNWVLCSRIRNGKYLFFTGLIETNHPKVLWGDHYNKGKKSFLFSVFSPDNTEMEIYYFRNFYPHVPPMREKNIREFLEVFSHPS